MFGFSCHGFQHTEWWHFTFGWTRKTKGVTRKTWIDHVWETNTWRHSLNTSRSESPRLFCKDDNFGTVWIILKLWNTICSGILPSSFHGFLKSKFTKVHIAATIFGYLIPRWLHQFCFAELQSLTLLDCQLHVAKSTWAACQLPTLPIAHVHFYTIHEFLNFCFEIFNILKNNTISVKAAIVLQ